MVLVGILHAHYLTHQGSPITYLNLSQRQWPLQLSWSTFHESTKLGIFLET